LKKQLAELQLDPLIDAEEVKRLKCEIEGQFTRAATENAEYNSPRLQKDSLPEASPSEFKLNGAANADDKLDRCDFYSPVLP